MGLLIANKICEKIHCSLSAKSEEGKRTIFLFELPTSKLICGLRSSDADEALESELPCTNRSIKQKDVNQMMCCNRRCSDLVLGNSQKEENNKPKENCEDNEIA